MNAIIESKTLSLDSSDGPCKAIVMSLSIPDIDDADSLLRDVAAQFKNQRYKCPADTCFLLITIVGKMTAAQFAREWNRLAAKDEILDRFMAQMQKAEVVRGTAAGQTLETVSLKKPVAV
jgi:hypothetical protein